MKLLVMFDLGLMLRFLYSGVIVRGNLFVKYECRKVFVVIVDVVYVVNVLIR